MTETKCICGAYKFEGAKHEARCPRAIRPPGRHTLEDPGISFTRVRFLEGQGPPQTDSYQPDGSPAEIVVGKLRCTFLGTRTIETTYGAGLVADVAILNDGDLAGLAVSFFCTSMLARLIVQVESGDEIEILRLPDKATRGGKAHQYQVDILRFRSADTETGKIATEAPQDARRAGESGEVSKDA